MTLGPGVDGENGGDDIETGVGELLLVRVGFGAAARAPRQAVLEERRHNEATANEFTR